MLPCRHTMVRQSDVQPDKPPFMPRMPPLVNPLSRLGTFTSKHMPMQVALRMASQLTLAHVLMQLTFKLLTCLLQRPWVVPAPSPHTHTHTNNDGQLSWDLPRYLTTSQMTIGSVIPIGFHRCLTRYCHALQSYSAETTPLPRVITLAIPIAIACSYTHRLHTYAI